jgi:hypothetical protein
MGPSSHQLPIQFIGHQRLVQGPLGPSGKRQPVSSSHGHGITVAFPSVSELNRATSHKLQSVLQKQAPGLTFSSPCILNALSSRPLWPEAVQPQVAPCRQLPLWAFICQYPMGPVFDGRQKTGFTGWFRNHSTAKVRLEACQELSNHACLLAFEI